VVVAVIAALQLSGLTSFLAGLWASGRIPYWLAAVSAFYLTTFAVTFSALGYNVYVSVVRRPPFVVMAER